MLRKFRVKNFLSFRDWQTLDLTVAGNAPEIPGRFVRSVPGSKDRFPTFVAIFGANASGKTNILRAMTFLIRFVQFSQNFPPNEPIASIPFFKGSSEKVGSEFEVELDAMLGTSKQRTKFHYRLSISSDLKEVLEEELIYFPSSRPRRLFSRHGQKFNFGDDFQIRRNDPSIGNIRRNCSVVSTLAHFNHFISEGIVSRLSSVQSNITDIIGNTELPINFMSNFYKLNPHVLDEFLELSRKFDMNIEKIQIVPTDRGAEPIYYHKGSDFPILSGFESNGTNKLFALFPMLYGVLDYGGVALIDEFDNAIHSLLLPELIDLFVDEERNPRNAQLIAVCQNPSVFQHLEKEEVYFAEKETDGATRIYGLKDVKGVRRESNIYANYIAGAFGGVPKLA